MASSGETAAPFLPATLTLNSLRDAIGGCKGCPLYIAATQAVFGDGARGAAILLVGEQPGNDEDIQGRPFVGPAGKILDRALKDAGIHRSAVYVTNAVKHFKFEERGKRRIHKKPSLRELTACRPWLEAEAQIVRPRVIGCLGATAARSVFGSGFHLLEDRGRPFPHPWAPHAVATLHPSAILRVPTPEQRDHDYKLLVSDLRVIRELAGTGKQGPSA